MRESFDIASPRPHLEMPAGGVLHFDAELVKAAV
jgi:hypothetical protein